MDIAGTARRMMDVPRQGVTTVLEAPQQVNHLWDQGTELIRRAGRLLDRAELIVARLEHKVSQLDTLIDSTWRLVERAGEVTELTDTVSREARETRKHAEEQVLRLSRLLDEYQPLLESLAPLGREAASSLGPAHVRGLAMLLDEVPNLVDRLQPALDGMGKLGPHLQDVTERMDNVGQVVEGLPGAKVLRRRGQAREDEGD